MSPRAEEAKARVALWLGRRASRRKNLVDKACRILLDRFMRLPDEDDFMRDDWIDSDVGFDPEELDRYQRGERDG